MKYLIKYKNIIIIVAIGLVAIFLLIYFIDKRDKTYKNEIDTYKVMYEDYKSKYINAMLIIDKQKIKVDSLNKIKNKGYVKYIDRIKEVGNPIIISNDSITRYISSRIYNRER